MPLKSLIAVICGYKSSQKCRIRIASMAANITLYQFFMKSFGKLKKNLFQLFFISVKKRGPKKRQKLKRYVDDDENDVNEAFPIEETSDTSDEDRDEEIDDLKVRGLPHLIIRSGVSFTSQLLRAQISKAQKIQPSCPSFFAL
jgi:hypothetical protein